MNPHVAHLANLTDAAPQIVPGETLDGSIFGPQNRCFACSPDHPIGFRLRFTIEAEQVVTRFTPGPEHQGAPTIMHGGLVPTLADEVGCWALIAMRRRFGFTGTMKSRFARPVRTGVETVGRAHITRESARLYHVDVRITQEETTCFSSDMSFIVMDQKGAAQMLGGPLPDVWKPFFR